MKKLLILIIGVIITFNSCKESNKLSKTENILKNRIESYIEECNKNGGSGSILVAQEGKVLFSGGFGVSNRNENFQITEETIFTTGSITKQFTATAILKLQEEGKLSVQDSISKFLVNVPIDKKDITIHQLLTHTSGIRGNLNNAGDFTPIEKEDFLNQIFHSSLNFPPGSMHRYSNIGYSILAIIIEEITQLDYEEYLQQELFSKAKMKNTGYLLPKWDETKMAHAYKCQENRATHLEKWKSTSNQVSYHLKGNGGILSTPSDLYKWYIALKKNIIIDEKSFEQLVHPQVSVSENGKFHYGYGWVISKSDRNTKKIEHNGSNGVFYAKFIRLPEEKHTVIIYMTNQVRYDTKNNAEELEKLIFDKNYTPMVPKMNSTKYFSGEEPNENMEVVNEFVSILLKTKTEQTIENFIKTHIPNTAKHKRFKEYFLAMQEEFKDYKLVHTLEYEDDTYDILLESKQGVIEELTPCFDLKFNEQNQITAFGW